MTKQTNTGFNVCSFIKWVNVCRYAVGLKARLELNGEVGLALRFEAATGRWLMRLRNGGAVHVDSP
jgi:hypothetical protein